jgi:hypothetical protein
MHHACRRIGVIYFELGRDVLFLHVEVKIRIQLFNYVEIPYHIENAILCLKISTFDISVKPDGASSFNY